MRFTLSSLKNFIETKATTKEICDALTFAGLEVESIYDKAASLVDFTIAHIIETKPHETSSKLKICLVQTTDSKEPLQIICGAPNARAGIKVVYARIGAIVPSNGMQIKKAKIAGIESSGMLCSAKELMIGNEEDGIIEIDQKWEVGTKVAEVFGLDDVVIEINVTPNRGDCLGVEGIARELVAKGIAVKKYFKIEKISGNFAFPFSLENQAPELCPYVKFRYLRNVKNTKSPDWLKNYLSLVGINSISAIVDVTNYVMHLLNRPMHAYDASKIKNKIIIRNCSSREKFITLGNLEIELEEENLVIADSDKPIALAGIIGSSNSSCDENTSDIVIEAACFDSSNIAKTGRKLNILSDARYRFERGVDQESCDTGIDLVTKLILEICKGEASEIAFCGAKQPLKQIKFDFNKVKKITTIDLSKDEMVKILSDLGFICAKDVISIPLHRHDIEIEEDLVEEIARIKGYENIANNQIRFDDFFTPSKEQIIESTLDIARSRLTNLGMTEVINWSFVDSKLIENLKGKTEISLILHNPIALDMDHMRQNLVIGLISNYKSNLTRGFNDCSIFEIGNIFNPDRSQALMISGIRVGNNQDHSHYHESRKFDIFDSKKDLYSLAEIFGIKVENLRLEQENLPNYYHQHRSGAIKLGKAIIGYFGELHPSTNQLFGIKSRINLFELFVDEIVKMEITPTKQQNKAFLASDYQEVERDFAFISDSSFPVEKLQKLILLVDKNLIKQSTIFDIFKGQNLPEGKKSIAVRVRIQAPDRTLSGIEIEELANKIITSAKKEGLALRDC